MGSGLCAQGIVIFLLLSALALTVIALVTDYWCDVSTKNLVASPVQKANNYRFGLWRRCYEDLPDDFYNNPDIDRSGKRCVWTYRDLVPKHFNSLPSKEQRLIHLSRSVIGLSIAASALLIAAVIVMICGGLPGDCNKIQRPTLYIGTAVIILFSAMCGMASGICFIGARDIEENSLLEFQYLWSFMIHWIGTGLSVVAGFIILCLVKHSTDDLTYNTKYYYDM